VRMVSYDRQTVNSPNPLARFSHRSRVAKSVALADKLLPQNGAIIDFGAGTALFLSMLGEKRPDVSLTAIEPFMPPSVDARIQYIRDFKAATVKADLITAFEVCEHLTDEETEQFLSDVTNSIRPNGKIIISVPIMIGGTLLLKELNRVFLFRRLSDYSVLELLAGTVGRAVRRPFDRGPTHKGFDFRWLRRKLGETFIIEAEIYSPLPLPWWINSQAFFVCRKS
jgi:hypothetical protein